MATVTAQSVDLLGTTVVANAAAATIDFVVPATAVAAIVRVVNGTGAAMTVKIDDANTQSPVNATSFDPDVTINLATGATRAFRISDLNRFRDRTTGKITLLFSATATSTVEVTYV